jgi:curved DNA-binding protein CbpA
MGERTAYDVLEISPTASVEEIKAAYRLIISMMHPDKFLQGSKQWERAHEKTKEINSAYEILGDSAKRQAYDAWLSQKHRAAKTQATANTSPSPTQAHPNYAGMTLNQINSIVDPVEREQARRIWYAANQPHQAQTHYETASSRPVRADGPPCRKCGVRLRTPQASVCAACGEPKVSKPEQRAQANQASSSPPNQSSTSTNSSQLGSAFRGLIGGGFIGWNLVAIFHGTVGAATISAFIFAGVGFIWGLAEKP